MRLKEVRQTVGDIAAIPQRINLIVALSFAAILIAAAALVIASAK